MQAKHAKGAGIALSAEILMTDMVPVFGSLALPALPRQKIATFCRASFVFFSYGNPR
jgi:hypothetical protein